MKKFNYLLAVMAAALLCACGGQKGEKVEIIPTVRVVEALPCGNGTTQQYPGKVVIAEDANVSFKVAGTLRRVPVKEGQHVSKGQLLAEMDDTDYKVQLKATEAEYAQIKADAERVIGLYKDGSTTASNYDKARYGLEQIEAKLQNHRNQLAYTKIYAPYDGYVQTVFMTDGETVGAGMPIVSVLSSGNPEIEINLPVSAYANRDAFSRFLCSFDVLPNQKLEATPISILPQANSNQLFKMRLKLTEKNDAVSPGMSTWVTIHCSEDGNTAVRVPSTCVLTENEKSYVFIYHANKQTVEKASVHVETLHTDGSVEITGKVSSGDQLVSSGVHHVQNGMKVKLVEPVSSSNVGGLM